MDKQFADAVERLRRYEADEDNGFTSVYEAHCRDFAGKLPAGLTCDVSDLAQAMLDSDRELLADAYLAEHPAPPVLTREGLESLRQVCMGIEIDVAAVEAARTSDFDAGVTEGYRHSHWARTVMYWCSLALFGCGILIGMAVGWDLAKRYGG